MNIQTRKLQDAVRQHCIQRYQYWVEKYQELIAADRDRSDHGYTKEALHIFPRYQLINAVLVEIERHDPEIFATLEEARFAFGKAASDAQDMFTQPPDGSIEQGVMNEERAFLRRYIEQLNEDDLALVKPLFYRRVLSTNESEAIWSRLESTWNITTEGWYPLTRPLLINIEIEAFQSSLFEREADLNQLRTILQSRGIDKVWELREYGPEYEMEVSIFEPIYNKAEGYWCDESMSWIIYASHESLITFGGWLLEEIKKKWPDWNERIWTHPF